MKLKQLSHFDLYIKLSQLKSIVQINKATNMELVKVSLNEVEKEVYRRINLEEDTYES